MFYCFPLLLLYCTRYTYVIVNYTIYIYTYLYSTSAHGIYLFILWNWCHVNVCVGWLDNIEQKIINCVALFRSVFTLRPLIKPPPRLIPIAALERRDRRVATEAIRQFFVTRGLLSHRRPSEGRQRTVRKVLAYLWYLTDDAIAKLYVMESFVK